MVAKVSVVEVWVMAGGGVDGCGVMSVNLAEPRNILLNPYHQCFVQS